MLIPWITGPRIAHLSGVLYFQIGNLPRFRKEVYKLGITDGITSNGKNVEKYYIVYSRGLDCL